MNPYDTTSGPRCEVCGEVLIGAERDWTTCGHCGGRSIHRSPRSYDPPALANVRQLHRDRARLTGSEAIVAVFFGLAGGLSLVLGLLALVGLAWVIDTVAGWAGGWVNLLTAAGGLGAVGVLAWAIWDPERIR